MAVQEQEDNHSIEARLWAYLAAPKAPVRGLSADRADATPEAISALAAGPVGSMGCGIASVTDGNREPALLIREKHELMDTRSIEIRARLFREAGTLPGAAMLTGSRQYVAWLDWHRNAQQEMIERLAEQEWTPVLWYDEHLFPTRQVRVFNQCTAALRAMIRTWEQREPWSATAFDRAVDRILATCPDLNAGPEAEEAAWLTGEASPAGVGEALAPGVVALHEEGDP